MLVEWLLLGLYEPRKDLKFGTNGFGDMNFILTYLNSEVSPTENDG